MSTRPRRTVWLRAEAIAILDAMKGPGESYSDVVLRLLLRRDAEPRKLTTSRTGRDPAMRKTP